MWIEDYELSVFCGILSDAYRDSYVEPSTDFVWLDGKYLDLGFEQFKQKKEQIKAFKKGRLLQLHFGCEGKTIDSIARHEQLFEQMKSCLLPYGVIFDGLQLKRSYFAWTWLLKNGVYVPKSIQDRLSLLNVQIDNRPLSKKEEKHVAIQAMAQVIGYENGYFDVQKMKGVIFRYLEDSPSILHLCDWQSLREYQNNQEGSDPSDRKDVMRDIEKLIASVRSNKTKGRPITSERQEQEIKLIPGIFEGKTIHFPRLFRALTCIVFMLISDKEMLDHISSHPILEKYRQNLPILFHDLINQHIQGTSKKSVAFFE